MKKLFNIFLVFLIAFFSVPVKNTQYVAAEAGKEKYVTPDEAYLMNYTIYEDGKQTTSMADSYFTKPGKILIKDNIKYAQIETDYENMVSELSTKSGDVVIVGKNGTNMIIQFKLDTSSTNLSMRVVVPPTPPILPEGYDHYFTTQIKFDEGSKQVIDVNDNLLVASDSANGPDFEIIDPKDPEQPGQPNDEEPEEGSGEDGNDENNESDEGNNGNNEGSEGSENENEGNDEGSTDPEEGNNDENNGNEEEANIELDDGYYTFDVTYLRSDNDNTSSMGRYLGNSAFVQEIDGKYELTVTVKDKSSVTKLQVNGKKPVEVVEDENGRYVRFVLDELDLITDAYVEYQAALPNGDIHKGQATFRIALDRYSEETAKAEDKPGYGLEEAPFEIGEGNYTFDVTYLRSDNDNTSSMGRYLGNSVFVQEIDGEYELTVTVKDKSSVTKLQVNGKDPVEVVEDKNGRYVRFVIDELDLISDAYVEYQAALPNGDIHKGQATFRIALDRYSEETAKTEDKPGYGIIPDVQAETGKEIDVSNTNKITIGNDEKSEVIIPNSLPDNVKVVITPKKEEVETPEELELAGEVYDFEFEGLESFDGTFTLKLGYDASKYPLDKYDIAIYYFNETSGEWELVENSRIEDGVVIAEVDHFSTYGVFATEKTAQEPEDQDQNNDDKQSGEAAITPDNAYTINYKILKDDKSGDSVANNFFTGEALLFKKDGKTYAHLTITDGDLVKELKNKYGDALLVRKNADGSIVVQLRVDNDLSDMLLSMHIVVPAGAIPGFPGYDEEHDAVLMFDKASQQEISVDSHKLVATGNKDNENGPFSDSSSGTPPASSVGGNDNNNNGKQPGKPNNGFGDNANGEDNNQGSENKNTTNNPKTGDTSQVWFFTILLVVSMIPLAISLRRRFA